jgi:DinB superfamily
MNPYVSQLGDRDPMTVIADTPGRLRELVDTLGPRVGLAPAPGKWSAREVLCHLADTEVTFAFRLRQALAEEHHVIQPYDQDRWGATYGRYDAATALETFAAVRRWNIALLRSVTPEEMAKPVTHPERGQMTFRTVVETMAGHDENHVRQIAGMAGL